jgi:hypothetical protein
VKLARSRKSGQKNIIANDTLAGFVCIVREYKSSRTGAIKNHHAKDGRCSTGTYLAIGHASRRKRYVKGTLNQ